MIKPTCVLIALALTCDIAHADGLQIGRAAVDITPPIGTPMLSPQRPPFLIKPAEGAHDPLHAKAIVLELNGQKAALVVCDLTSMPVRLIEEVRRAIGSKTDIRPEAAMISATHTHTTPQIRLRFLGKANDAAREKIETYVAALSGMIADAVRQANDNLTSASVSAAIGREETIGFNRRFVLKDGTVATNPSGEIMRPAGPIDPDVGVVYFEGADGSPLATEVNFAIHLDTMGGAQFSADFPFMLDRVLAETRGAQMLTMFSTGAAGNVNHYNLLAPTGPQRAKGVRESSRIGAALAAEVLRTYPRLQPLDASSLRTAREVVQLEMPREKGLALAAQFKNAPTFFDGEMDVTNAGGRQRFEAEVQVIALGSELAWVGLPGEMFVEHGLAIKQSSPFRYTIIHELANGSIGYVPNYRSYPEGGYEVTATRCGPGSGETLAHTATRLLVELKNAGRDQVDPQKHLCDNKTSDDL